MRQWRHGRPKRYDDLEVESLLESLDVAFERRGRELWARCPHPDHDDGSPSWSIVADKHANNNGAHNCFSCGFGGGPLELVRAVLEVDREEAAEFLKGAHRRPPALEAQVEVKPVVLGRGMTMPAGYRFRPLAEMPSLFREYLGSREIDEGLVAVYRIGYATDGRLAGRVIFPMISRTGDVLSYTARAATGGLKRYKEPREEERASKSAVFGEHVWPSIEEARDWTLFLTEGCFDALTLAVALRSFPGLQRVAVGALHGSQLMPGQAVKIATFGQVVAATDPDDAGDRIAATLAEALGRHSRVWRLRSPVGFDWSKMGSANSVEFLRGFRLPDGRPLCPTDG